MEDEDLIKFQWKNDILICNIITEKTIDEKTAIRLVSLRKVETKNKPIKIVMIFPKLTHMDKGGRDYLSSDEAKKGILASAMVVKTVIGKVVINFFLKLNNRNDNAIPNKVFNTEDEALEWLENLPLN